MFAVSQHIKRLFPVRLRMCMLVLAVLVFGQFTAAAHTHDGHEHEDVPVVCDICLSAYFDEDDFHSEADDKPDLIDPPVYVSISIFSWPQNIIAPVFSRECLGRHTFSDVNFRPHAPRAPPV